MQLNNQLTSSNVVGTPIEIQSSTHYASFDDLEFSYKRCVEKMIELEQTNGTTALVNVSSNNISNIVEKTIQNIRFSFRWPFVRKLQRKILSFDCFNKHYEVYCSLSALAETLNIKYESYAEMMLKDTIKHG